MQKYYFQDYCLHVCAPQERASNYILHTLEQKVLNSYRKPPRKELQPGHQLRPPPQLPAEHKAADFTSLRCAQFTGTDWVAGCCLSRWRWDRACSGPHSAHGTTSHKLSFKQPTVSQLSGVCLQTATRQPFFP